MWFVSLILLLIIYTFGPGMVLVRPLRLAPAARLVVAIGVGLFADFVLSFALFALRQPPSTHVITGILALVLGVAGLPDWRRVLRCRQVRRMLWCWLCLLLFGGLLLSMIRHYGGGTWSGDWIEHIERTAFFMQSNQPDFTPDQTFLAPSNYPVPMRPPMMNAITAGLLSLALEPDQLYAQYQIVFLFLNSLVFFPCALLVPRMVKLSPRRARKATWTLAAVFAASPMFCQNLTYAWTKLFAAFYAILAIAIYLTAWRRTIKDEGRRMKDEVGRKANVVTSSFILQSSSLQFSLAFCLLCVGFLVHYSVGPYALFVGLHYLLVAWRRRRHKWREAAVIGAASVAVLATWFAWSLATYGPKPTFTSTSAVSDAKPTAAQNALNIAKNAGNTLYPRVLQRFDLIRDPPAGGTQEAAAGDENEKIRVDLEQPSTAGKVRDFFFLIYQVSLPGGLGLVGCGIGVWLLLRAWRGTTPTNPGVRRFWIACIPVVFIVGVAVYGGEDRFGVAHICLQPLALMGLCLLAGGIWTLGVAARAVFAAGLLLDFALGVFLQAAMEHRVIPFEHVPRFEAAGQPMVDSKGVQIMVDTPTPTPDVPSRAAQSNQAQKGPRNFLFWGDNFPEALPIEVCLVSLLAFLMAKGLILTPPPPKPEPAPKLRGRKKG